MSRSDGVKRVQRGRVHLRYWLAIIFIMAVNCLAQAQELKFARLGDFQVESGETIRDCQLGYRTFGQLAADKSNVVLFPTWALGTSGQAAGLVGPGKLLDSNKFYIVIVDALSNGVSSSPSNSKLQPRMQYPHITIADMVNAEYWLVTKTLHINHLKAVVGQSMGGMQAFEWMVAYPNFMDFAIPIVGSPRLASYDLVLWRTEIDAIKRDAAWKNGDYASNPARVAEAEIQALTITTPEAYNTQVPRSGVAASLAAAFAKPGADANDHIRQAEAMIAMDVAQKFNGSMEQAASHVKAKVLVIVSQRDHTVTPQPALAFAGLLHAETLVLDSDCGHLAAVCEADRVSRRVSEFLSSNGASKAEQR